MCGDATEGAGALPAGLAVLGGGLVGGSALVLGPAVIQAHVGFHPGQVQALVFEEVSDEEKPLPNSSGSRADDWA